MAIYSIQIKNLEKLQNAISSAPETVFNELSKAIKTSVNIARPILRDEAPVKSGKLSRNIYSRSAGLRGELGPNLNITPYAWWVHQGTSPYEITPTNKKALYWQGAPYPVRRVRHPGIKANPFVEKAFDRIKEPVQMIFRNTITKIINSIKTG